MIFIDRLRIWKKEFKERIQYSGKTRFPFYDLAYKYMPNNDDAVVIDIGAGNGTFASYLKLQKYKNLYLLDGNGTTVEKLKNIYSNSLLYRIPNKMSFDNLSVDFIHCSHVVEHLHSEDLYKFMQEIDRVLKNGGILVISAPLLWSRFYEDLSHVRPYNPKIFVKYFCKQSDNGTKDFISNKYIVKKIIYRWRQCPVDEYGSWGSGILIIDLFIKIVQKVIFKFGFKKYIKNGYTIILEKNI